MFYPQTYRQHYVAFCKVKHAECVAKRDFRGARNYRRMIAQAKSRP